MSNDHIEDTHPRKIQPESVSAPLPPKAVKKPKRWPWILGGVFLIVLLGAAGAYFGYRSAVQSRLQKATSELALIATTQFEMAAQDIEAGRLETARKRLEYVVQVDPNFPGVSEKLSEVMLKMAMVETPTPNVTPTFAPSPTPDMRGVEELFNQAQQFMVEKNWNAAISTLDILRKEDINYRSLDVDGMYYISLRYRGIDKIVLEGNLEGGIYDLALTERFGPLDKEADSYRNWARYYLTGTSFWGVDWTRVIELFSQIYPSLPNLRDGSGWTAMERYRVASIKYGDQLAAKEDYCGARDQYRNALSLAQDSNLAPTATAVQLICSPPTATPAPVTPTSPVEVTPEVTVETPPSEVTVAPTEPAEGEVTPP